MIHPRLPTVAHLRAAARRRVPKIAFDYVDGAAGGDEAAAVNNRAAFSRLHLLPRVLIECETRSLKRNLFGITYDLPFAVAPIGLCNIVWPGADRALARQARAANIPYILSTAGTCTIEAMAEIAGDHGWFQLYVGRDPAITDDLISRADKAEVPVLVVTVDVPAPAHRVRDIVNGFTLPLRPTLKTALDTATCPAWLWATARAGAPRFVNLEPYAGASIGTQPLAAFMARQVTSRLDWALLAQIRDRWPRRLIVKGVMHPQDAVRCAELGIDAVVVSNHGGRQLEDVPAPIDLLPAVRAAVGDRMAVLVDSGVRTGGDIAKALALGADFVLLGRAFLYGVGALGPEKGPAAVLEILRKDLDGTIAQLGCRTLDELGPHHIWTRDSRPVEGV